MMSFPFFYFDICQSTEGESESEIENYFVAQSNANANSELKEERTDISS